MFDELQDPRFVKINRSAFVNLEYVDGLQRNRAFNKNEVLLTTGQALESSTILWADVQESVTAFWRGVRRI